MDEYKMARPAHIRFRIDFFGIDSIEPIASALSDMADSFAIYLNDLSISDPWIQEGIDDIRNELS